MRAFSSTTWFSFLAFFYLFSYTWWQCLATLVVFTRLIFWHIKYKNQVFIEYCFLAVKIHTMQQNKLSSRFHRLIKAAIAAAVLPVIVIYVMIARPDYRILNGISHTVVPIARGVGDFISWPVRATARGIGNLRELSNLRSENAELRARLAAADALQNEYEIAVHENQKLAQELDIVQQNNRQVIVADIIHDSTSIAHNTFFVNRGTSSGVNNGMAVISMDKQMMGLVIDATAYRARVRSIIDSDSNIAVRIAGSEVYGFLRGNGSKIPTIGFFSDPEFQPTGGIKLVTSVISGVIPGEIYVGTLVNDTDVDVLNPGKVTRVMILGFDTENEYNK